MSSVRRVSLIWSFFWCWHSLYFVHCICFHQARSMFTSLAMFWNRSLLKMATFSNVLIHISCPPIQHSIPYVHLLCLWCPLRFSVHLINFFLSAVSCRYADRRVEGALNKNYMQDSAWNIQTPPFPLMFFYWKLMSHF